MVKVAGCGGCSGSWFQNASGVGAGSARTLCDTRARQNMLYHIVLLRVRDDATPPATQAMMDAIHGLSTQIPCIVSVAGRRYGSRRRGRDA